MKTCEICKEREAVIFSEHEICLTCYDAMKDIDKEEREVEELERLRQDCVEYLQPGDRTNIYVDLRCDNDGDFSIVFEINLPAYKNTLETKQNYTQKITEFWNQENSILEGCNLEVNFL